MKTKVSWDLFSVDGSVSVSSIPDYEVCQGDAVQLKTFTTSKDFTWVPLNDISDPKSLQPLASPKQSTTYRLIAHSNNACPDDTTFLYIKVKPAPSIKAQTNKKDVLAGDTVTLTGIGSGDITSYMWQPASVLITSPNAKTVTWEADISRTFKINVMNQYACPASDTVSIIVHCSNLKIYVPSAFTPNGTVLTTSLRLFQNSKSR